MNASRVLLRSLAAATSFAMLLAGTAARAELVLGDLIVELQQGKQAREDVEIWNDSPDRSFVAVEPREIINPGLPSQSVRQDPDPERLGILVSPARMILEPGQRRLLRVANLSADPAREHVYRVTVKPVVGAIQSDASGLKIMVGYDVLVLVRPARPEVNLVALRNGRSLYFSNKGNLSVEIVDGRQCARARSNCVQLPGKRLYSGASWTVQLQSDFPAEYMVKSPDRTERRTF